MQTKPYEPKTAIATEMFLPNHSGDHSKGQVLTTPTSDYDIVNKKYVDDNGTDLIFTKAFYLENPSGSDVYPICFIDEAATINEVWAETDTGTIDFNIEKRSHGSAESAGTNIWSSDVQADDDGYNTTTFNSSSVTANQWLFFCASTKSGSPIKVWVVVKYTLD